MNIDISQISYTADVFGIEPAENFDEAYAALIQADLKAAQANLDALPENDRRGLTMKTLRHFNCGYLQNWVLTKCRAEFLCGIYVDDLTREPKRLPPPSPRIIIPTSQRHFHATATDSARLSMDKKYWKQHGGKMDGESFNVADALKRDLIVVVEGEIDAMSIWQSTQGAVAVVAILGCGNGRKSLLPYVDDLRGKKLLLLLDADKAGKKAAKKFLDELSALGLLAVNRTLYDAMHATDQKAFGNNPKNVDANSLLTQSQSLLTCDGNAYLRGLVERIIEDAEPEFDERRKELDAHNLFVQQNNAEADAQPSTLKKPEPQPSKTSNENRRADVSKLPREEFDLILRDYVHARDLHHDEWHNVATIMREYGYTVEDFKAWSNDGDRRYDEKACESTWKPSRGDTNKPVTVATLIHYAKQHGYQPKHAAVDGDELAYLFSGDLSDDDFAKKLVFMYGDRIRYLAAPDDEWLLFNRNGEGGAVWTNAGEKNSVLYPFAADLAEKLVAAAKNKDQREFGRKLKDTKKKNSSIAAIKGIRNVIITPTDLDTHDNLLNCRNGVVDLQTGNFYETVDPALLLTQQANAVYRKDYRNPVVDKFLADILPNEPTRAALIRFLGYAATGSCCEEKALFCNGDGGNGKGTLTRTLLKLYGNYATTLRTSAVLFAGREQDAGAATTELNPLENCRVAFIDELPQGGKLDAAKFKNLTGGDPIPARKLHHEQYTIEPHFALILSGNYLPEISDTRDNGILRRLMNITFDQSFIGERRDPNLKAKLAADDALSGLLTLIVDAAQMWYRDGLLESDAMKQARQDYLNANDFIGEFIDEFCERGADFSIPRKQLLAKLKAEYPSECFKLFGNADNRLTDAVKRVDGITYTRRKEGKVFVGVRWKDTRDEFSGEPIDPRDTPF